jgi:murein DD-endopeptidase MepM/ murein hydrolase activator NlpD
MNPFKPLILLAIWLPIGLSPSQALTQEPPLAMPLAMITSQDTLNHYIAAMTEYGEGHRGIDLPAQIGEQVLSPASGQISFSGKVGYRNVVSIQFGNSFTASLEPVCSELFEGTNVLVGEVIGLVCEPDLEYLWHCGQTCLHFGTRSASGYFSPLALIGGLSPSRLVF